MESHGTPEAPTLGTLDSPGSFLPGPPSARFDKTKEVLPGKKCWRLSFHI